MCLVLVGCALVFAALSFPGEPYLQGGKNLGEMCEAPFGSRPRLTRVGDGLSVGDAQRTRSSTQSFDIAGTV